MRERILVALLLCCLAAPALAAPKTTIVVWAPGYPGDTEQAQETMDAFARDVARAAGWSRGAVRSVYHQTVEGGLAALGSGAVGVAVVPAPVYYQYRSRLALEPLLEAEPAEGKNEVWSLVAKKGRVASADSLAGWELAGAVGYAPDFVRGPVLGAWGNLPESARITFTPRVLSALRRTASGEDVAVLTDRAQAGALDGLPFAADLEVVARSAALPASFVCTVGGRLDDGQRAGLRSALLSLHDTDWGRETLAAMRLARFAPVSPDSLRRLGPVDR